MNEKTRTLLARFRELGIAEQIDHEKFYLYSIVTHSTAIEGSTVTLRREPEVTQTQIADLIGIHRVNVNRNIQQLVSLGLLRREGSDRKGRWIITLKS